MLRLLLGRFGAGTGVALHVPKPFGRRPEEKRLRALADSSVQILVNRSAEELRRLYRTCAFFVQPGEEDFGIAAVEALACGAPVVAVARYARRAHGNSSVSSP